MDDRDNKDSGRPERTGEPARTTVTGEVGSEGGSPGDVEEVSTPEPTDGAEGDATVLAPREARRPLARDIAGRRSPK